MNLFETIISILRNIAESLGLSYMIAIFVGLLLIAFFMTVVVTRTSYETQLLKAIDGFNAYFHKKPYITDENLVEFNNRMKDAPSILRNRWQFYILNREDPLEKYINIDSCVEKPLKTSNIDKSLKNFSSIALVLGIASALLGAGLLTSTFTLPEILFRALATPMLIAVLWLVAVLIIRALKNAVQSDIYEYFHIFEQNMVRAVTSLPPYIDYEILFTRKEIKDSIPILQQYLEKRALLEQEELEKARKNAVDVETYNFDELGLNSSLVLERAMRECEIFLSTKKRLQLESDSIETERANYEKNYDNISKEFQRKLQISRENLENLKRQQEASITRVEGNYIKKQQADEIKKQQQIEKDADSAEIKFKEEQAALKAEIEKRKAEIEEHRVHVESIMKLEFKNYAQLVYSKLKELATRAVGSDYERMIEENQSLKNMIRHCKEDNGAQIERLAEQLEEEEYTREIYKERPIPKFISNNFDISEESLQELKDDLNAGSAPALQQVSPAQTQTQKAEIARPKMNEEIKPLNPQAEQSTVSDDALTFTLDQLDDTSEVSDEDDGGRQSEVSDDEDVVLKRLNTYIKDKAKNIADDEEEEVSKKSVSQKIVKDNEEELQTINKKLKEESDKLNHQKEEFSNEINSTLSKMDQKQYEVNEKLSSKLNEVDRKLAELDAKKAELERAASVKRAEMERDAAVKKAELEAAASIKQAELEKAAAEHSAKISKTAAAATTARKRTTTTAKRTTTTAKKPAVRKKPIASGGESIDDILNQMDKLSNTLKKTVRKNDE